MEQTPDKKLRYSRKREMIYTYLLASYEHPSAEMVYEALRSELEDLSLGTVYRNLKQLEELGKVRRVTSVEGTERYDARCHDHAHFVCECCKTVTDLPTPDSDGVIANFASSSGIRVKWINITLGGVCANCEAKSAAHSGMI